jgi:large subunit ribosomal protein L15
VKLHDLRPAPGAHKPKRRVGRGIAAGQGKTAGRGTKGQKARAGGTIPAWFEGGQTPLHQRIPKLRGFRNPFRIAYEIVNVGDIARLVELGVLEAGELPAATPGRAGKARPAAPITVNQELLRAAGLVRTLDRPMKVLGGGELSTALFVLADAFSASARRKIEAAGGTASVIEAGAMKTPALGVGAPAQATDATAPATDATAPATAAPGATADEEVPARGPEARPEPGASPEAADEGGARPQAGRRRKAEVVATDVTEAAPAKAAAAKAAAAKAAAAKAAAAEAPKPAAKAARKPASKAGAPEPPAAEPA